MGAVIYFDHNITGQDIKRRDVLFALDLESGGLVGDVGQVPADAGRIPASDLGSAQQDADQKITIAGAMCRIRPPGHRSAVVVKSFEVAAH
ncbi:hypothetical protein NicSoilB8_28620 [Arthrobacter sp. NicSoilB8]|nr:hypothetical protein NicSoilB8_28620 [Arthrobacter sp. NicSoilB8]